MASAEQDIASGEGDKHTRDSIVASAEQDIASGELEGDKATGDSEVASAEPGITTSDVGQQGTAESDIEERKAERPTRGVE